MGWYLLVKKAESLGISYLCKLDDRRDPIKYRGSGKLWNRYLKKHNPELTTEILGHYETKQELQIAGLFYSNLWNVVESNEWANLIPEVGDGGPTIAGRVRAFNLSNPKESKCFESIDLIPEGWQHGMPKWKKSANSVAKTVSVHRGRKRSAETRAKMAEAWRGKRSDSHNPRPTKSCSFCGKEVDLQNFNRHETRYCEKRNAQAIHKH